MIFKAASSVVTPLLQVAPSQETAYHPLCSDPVSLLTTSSLNSAFYNHSNLEEKGHHSPSLKLKGTSLTSELLKGTNSLCQTSIYLTSSRYCKSKSNMMKWVRNWVRTLPHFQILYLQLHFPKILPKRIFSFTNLTKILWVFTKIRIKSYLCKIILSKRSKNFNLKDRKSWWRAKANMIQRRIRNSLVLMRASRAPGYRILDPLNKLIRKILLA